MALTPQWLDELRARVTLSSVISRTTRLTKAGHEFKACCPFHNEKSPSFTVNDQKGFYHCFGCGAHGDVIRWMTDQRGLSFMDAVKELAAEAGLDVPAPDPRAARKAEQQAGLHEVLEAAQNFYRAQLETPEGTKARAYLASRRFDPLTMERFGFGYAPAGRQALKSALSQFDDAMLIEAGMRIAVDDKEPYDRFRDRLTMPIHDARGRVIGFAARILDADKKDAPKYLNSPDTPLFDKGRTLFNLHRAGPASRQSGRIVVVEGQMDVIALAAAGIGEAVAPMGTALTETQLEMLWRLVETPILCFDGDAAGQRAAMRAVTRALPLLRPAHSLQIVRMPAGKDPDDLIKEKGVAALEALLANSMPLIDFLWQVERDRLPLVTPEDKIGFKNRLHDHADTIANEDIKRLYKREFSDRFSAFAFPRRDWSVHGQKVTSIKAARSVRAEKHANWNEAERKRTYKRLGSAIAAGFILRPWLLAQYAEKLATVHDADPRLFLMVDESLEMGHLEPGRLETILAAAGLELPKPEEFDFLRFSFVWTETKDEEGAAIALGKAVELYADQPAIEAALASASARYQAEVSEETRIEHERLLKRKLEFDARLRQMASARTAALDGVAAEKTAE